MLVDVMPPKGSRAPDSRAAATRSRKSDAAPQRRAAARAPRRTSTAPASRKRAAPEDREATPKRARSSLLNEPPTAIPPLTAGDIAQGLAGRRTMGALYATQGGVPASSGEEVVPRKLFVWGTGEAGQLSLGGPDDDNINKLTKPKPFGNKALSQQTDAGELGVGGATMIAAGGMHSLVVDAHGRILSCGSDDHGTLGRQYRESSDESEDDFYYVLRPVDGVSPTGKGVPAPENGQVLRFHATRVAASDGCSVALDAEGRLVAWGHFKDGEGKVCFADTDEDGAPKEQWFPSPIAALDHERFAQVACGENHILALTLDGRVYSWRLNSMSQLGRFANLYHIRARFAKRDPPASMILTPGVIAELKNIVHIACGLNASFAVDADGRVFAWGLNTRGQTGTGLKKDKVTRPTRVKALEPAHLDGARVVQIAGGEFHTAFLLSNGQVWICGDGDEGKLGLPSTHSAMASTDGAPAQLRTPVHVPMPMPPSYASDSAKTAEGGTRVIGIAAGMRFTFALAAEGTLYSWGTTSDEAMGQPADVWGEDQSKDTPTAVPMPGEPGAWAIAAVATAGQHSLALAVRAP